MSTLKHAADIISKYGRNGDTMLMHITPDEISILESFTGVPVTVNPRTGLPEAWSWKKFLGGLAAAAGIAFTGGAAAPFLAPAMAAMGLGAAISDKGAPKDPKMSEAGEYLKKANAEAAKDQYKFPLYIQQSTEAAPDLLGRQQNHFSYPGSSIRRMGQGIGEEELGFAGGGLSSVGRFLEGPGGGLDDAIPARIGGLREAALSDGEYIVPADVVSMLGDGSSKAGATRLDKMLADVRVQKTGRAKQAGKLKGKVVPRG